MRIINRISYCSPTPSVVALGCFDGVHLGHASVIKAATEQAKKLNLPCVVFTFDEPPRSFLSSEPTPIITSPEKKAELISELGADILLSVPFTMDIARLSPLDFSEQILKNNLHAAHVVCGFDYTFGSMAKGNTEFLADFCDKRKIGLTIIPKLEINGDRVSSTLIRELISNGKVERAAELLGRRYSLSAKVIGDKGLARDLGFATANQVFSEKTLLPKNAVYATRAIINGVSLPAITNFGTRPTVNGTTRCAETHILDFNENIYEKTLDIELVSFIRDEKKFDSLSALKEQVLNDIQYVKDLCK